MRPPMHDVLRPPIVVIGTNGRFASAISTHQVENFGLLARGASDTGEKAECAGKKAFFVPLTRVLSFVDGGPSGSGFKPQRARWSERFGRYSLSQIIVYASRCSRRITHSMVNIVANNHIKTAFRRTVKAAS